MGAKRHTTRTTRNYAYAHTQADYTRTSRALLTIIIDIHMDGYASLKAKPHNRDRYIATTLQKPTCQTT